MRLLSRTPDCRFTMRLYYEDIKVDTFSINLKYVTGGAVPRFECEITLSHDIFVVKDKLEGFETIFVLRVVVNSMPEVTKNQTDKRSLIKKGIRTSLRKIIRWKSKRFESD